MLVPPRSQQWLSAVETGENRVTVRDLAQLALVYGVRPDSLILDGPRVAEPRAEYLASAPVGIPVLDQEAHAGSAGAAILDYVYWAPQRVAGRHIQGVKVRGDCMRPEVLPGDVVFIDRDRTARAGNVVVVSAGDELHICRAQADRKGGLVFVNSDGVFTASEARLEGVVVQIARDVG